MTQQLMAIAAEGQRGRVYVSPDNQHVRAAQGVDPSWRPDALLPQNPRDFKTPNYGLTTFADLFTPRQLVALNTFSDLVNEVHHLVRRDAVAAGLSDDMVGLAQRGDSAQAYADAVSVYLTFSIAKATEFWCSIATWSAHPKNELVTNAFKRQAIPMTWDFAEASPFSRSGANFEGIVTMVSEVLDNI